MLRVAHILRRFSFEEWGGIESVAWESVLHLRRLGVDAEIVCTSALSRPGTEIRDGVKIRRFKYLYPYFPMNVVARGDLDKKGGNPWCPELFRWLAEGKYDLLHIYTGGRLAQVAVKTGRDLGIPTLMCLHGGFADVPREELRQMMAPTRLKFNYGGILDRLKGYRLDAVGSCDGVMCIGHGEENLLRERYPQQDIVYFPDGVDCQKFATAPSVSARQAWNIPPERKVVVCIARIDYQKGQKLLVDFLSQTKDTHVVLVGPVTSQWYCTEIRDLVREREVSDRFTLIPGLSPDDPLLVSILHEADAFVLPSVHEPFGVVVLEAWAAGLPVIGSRVGGLRDLLVDGLCGLTFDSGDLSGLVGAWERLNKEPGLRARLRAGGLAAVKKYDWSLLARDLVDVYEKKILSKNSHKVIRGIYG